MRLPWLYTSTPEVIYSTPGSYILNPQKLYIQVSQVGSTRPERAEAPSPGHRPGYTSNRQGAL